MMGFFTHLSTLPKLSVLIGSLSLAKILSLIVVLLFMRWVVRGIYRVYFHPLSRFPGPKFSAFTRIPHITAIAKGVLPEHVNRLHEKYGEVVRISPDELSFTNPKAWRDIYGYGSKEGKGSAPHKNWSRRAKSANGANSIIMEPDPVEHGRLRKIFSPAFSDRALIQQAPLFTKYVDQLVSNMREGTKKTTPVDLVRLYNFTTFDVMGDLTFGEPLHMLDNAEYDPWVQVIFANIKRSAQLGLIYNYYPLIGRMVHAMLHGKLAQKQMEHHNYSVTRVTKRLEKGRASEGVDLWDLILQQEEKGKAGIQRDEMDANGGLFMIAGTETTATLLSGLTYLLLTHPQSMKKLIEEVRTAFSSSDAISMEVMAGLPYLNACIKEAFRQYPPVPIGLPHLTPVAGSTVCGYYVPPNMNVAASHWAMYNSEQNFKDSKSFVPERWLGDERYANDERTALQPFSVGPRDCLGKNMAYHEMRLILTKVLYNFDLELLPESANWIADQKVYSLWQKTPLMVKVKTVGSA